MATTPTMHFGPEWMRPKASRTGTGGTRAPSPPPAIITSNSYSSLVSAGAGTVPNETRDSEHPFRYTKQDILHIFAEHMPSLGLEVERWPGIVQDQPQEPVSSKEMTEAEKKLFAGPSLNSEARRRQSNAADLVSPSSPLRERFNITRRNTKDSGDPHSPIFVRKNSVSGQPPLMSPALPSPRPRGSGFDGVLSNPSAEPWTSARRRASEAKLNGHVQQPLDEEPSSPSLAHPGTAGVEDSHPQPVLPSTPPPPPRSQHQSPIPQAPPTNVPLDLSQVEWSYVDPTGTIQGPFKASQMQGWHDGGYFTPDLKMKRTNLDNQFVTLGELMMWATGPKLFLSPLVPPTTLPPGLGGGIDHSLNGPYQPSPMRTLRNPIDSFGTGSNPSDSPASSYGARGFNGSPDPAAFGGRGFPDQTLNGHSFGAPADPFTSRKSSYSSAGFDVGFNGSPHLPQGHPSANPWTNQSAPFGGHDPNSYGFPPQPFAPTRQPEPDSAFSSPGASFGQPLYPGASTTMTPSPLVPQAQSTFVPQSQAVWEKGSDTGSSHKRDPFSIAPPTAFNAPPLKSNPSSSTWDGISRHPSGSQPPNDNSSTWYAASKGATDQGWNRESSPDVNAQVPTEPSSAIPQEATAQHSLTVDNLGQHNLHHQQGSSQKTPSPELPEPAIPVTEALEAPAPVEPSPSIESPTEVAALAPSPAITSKSKKKKEAKANSVTLVPAPVQAEPRITSPSGAIPPKAPWAKDDEKKPTSVSLRDIQEAERKNEEAKARARKVLEKDQPRPKEEPVPEASPSFTGPVTAWGLPTSRAGVATPAKETSPTPSAAVWNGSTSNIAPKKTMKEIQQEEERRRKMVPKETSAAIASRRTPAEAAKAAPAPATTQGGAWTTIGAGGKISRPAAITAASSTSSVPRANGSGPSRQPAVVVPPVAAAKSPSLPTSAVDASTATVPSSDFMKWLANALSGLNSDANVEQIMQILLDFPVDADAEVVEIMAELVYQNSKTMDGRRFAADFTSKRKADLKNGGARASGAGASGTKGAVVSIADVVKAQPKPTPQDGWSFKVVNKKKKGGRS